MNTKIFFGVIALIVSAAAMSSAEEHTLHSFQKTQLSDQFFCEGANFGDFNRDGAMDIVSGPFWYAGPKFTERFEYYPPKPFDIANYSDNFFAFTHDVDEDGWQDIVIIGFPGENTLWFQNPQGKPGHWPRHVALAVTDNESPTFTDLTGDDRPDLVCSTGGQMGYAEIPQDDPKQPWKFRPISPNRGYQRYTHGMGVGDVNGDGRQDILEKNGWYEQPVGAASRAALSGPPRLGGPTDSEFWTFHEVRFAEAGGAQMLVYDVDGDGDNDVVTSKAAHAYGLSWFEHENDDNGAITFREHLIMGERPEQNDYGVVFSQLHALALVDMDRDGVQDVVTGKRWWAHKELDPGSLDPAVLYCFRTVRDGGKARFVPYRIDNNSGVGTQVVAGDINGDEWPDIVVGSKKGTFVLTHQVKNVDEATWKAAQPVARADSTQASSKQQPEDGGFPAKGADGRTLNLDFETGDLADWAAEGNAFGRQPIEGDTVHARRTDSYSGHQGKYWLGTYEGSGDGPQGILTSVSFPLQHRYASFLIGGGSGGALRAEIVRSDTGEVVFKASGLNREEMRPVVADLEDVQGKEIFVRIVDHGSAGWGHVNFDHFRLHDELPETEDTLRSRISDADTYPYAGLPAEQAARVMKLPDDFKVVVSAAEPDVKQPIAMAIDDRGRVWVAEAYEYPVRAPEGQGRDRILIFEDTDGDGRFDNRKIFTEGLNLVSGLEVGFGGVWVGAAPYLMFIPDHDGDDKPDGKPQILLDGWAWQDTHETLNAFIWGPDGWLYGCHGVFTHSRVGKPGTPDAERIPLNAAIWRYHPTRHVFEIFSEGTSNPWGVDFDDRGQAFCTACVIPHLYHVIQGARYQRQAGSHFNPYTYAEIQTIADHLHYLGEHSHARNDSSGAAGGGHAHSGAMIYLGGAWPDEYRGRIFMNNIHGQRLNTDILKPKGSGFVGSHGPDFLLSGDLASQILNIRYGPDGNAYFIDWYDTNACHHNNVEGHDRSNGRVYKVVYGDKKATPVDLKNLGDEELAMMFAQENDWYVRHARRILQERAAAGKLDESVRELLSGLAVRHFEPRRQLRAIWALHVTGGLPDDVISALLEDKDEHVRAWSIQLALDRENSNLADLRQRFTKLAETDSSPVVRLYLASALQRMPLGERWDILRALTRHAEDAKDHNLPLMYWYAAEPLGEADPDRAICFGLSCGGTFPMLRDFMMRRIGSSDASSSRAAIVRVLNASASAEEQLAILRATREAFKGQRRIEPPKKWPDTYRKLAASDNSEVRAEATALGVTFGDEAAFKSLRDVVTSKTAGAESRRDALNSLLAARDKGLVSTLHALLAEPSMRDLALSGLAAYDDASTPSKVLAIYAGLSLEEKRMALATLAARPAFGTALLQAVADKKIPATDLSADLVRQLHNLKNEEVDKLVAEIWGQVRPTAEDKAKLIAEYRDLLADTPAKKPDMQLGRAVFTKTCGQCHKLYGAGDTIAPDLTGSNRADLEYLLSNVLDPSALIAKEYQSTVVVTVDGRVVTGLITAEDDKSLTIRTATETLVLPKDEIEERTLGDVSMMPDDQLKQFKPHEILSLFEYLRGKRQVPMLATAENASLLFNSRDFTGWTGDSQLWSVEDGEIVGRSPGLKHNTFLVSDLSVANFRLSLEAKLANDAGNSGVQFRSTPIKGFEELRGYQADIGPGWWGKLYEENGRALLWDKSGEAHVKKGEWNRYEIEAVGSRVRTWINGNLCVDLDDPDGRRRGVIALQIHSGDAMEVRFRDLKLEVK